LDSIKQI